MKIVRVVVALIPVAGITVACILFWVGVGVSNSAVQEIDVTAISACAIIGSYTLSRSIKWVLDVVRPLPR